jgi:hypothetical protein
MLGQPDRAQHEVRHLRPMAANSSQLCPNNWADPNRPAESHCVSRCEMRGIREQRKRDVAERFESHWDSHDLSDNAEVARPIPVGPTAEAALPVSGRGRVEAMLDGPICRGELMLTA